MDKLMRIIGLMVLAMGASSSYGNEQYKAPNGIGISRSHPDITPLVRSEKWAEEEQHRIQTFPSTDRTLSSEEEDFRPVLDLRRFPSSQGFGEQQHSEPRLMLDNDWEIIWREKEENIVKPQHWKYQSPN